VHPETEYARDAYAMLERDQDAKKRARTIARALAALIGSVLIRLLEGPGIERTAPSPDF